MARLSLVLLFAGCTGAPQEQTNVGNPPAAPPTQRAVVPAETVPNGDLDARPAPPNCPEGMLPVPGGRFVMGQANGEAGSDEGPVHLVMVDGFCMDRTEAVQQGTNRPWVGLSWAEAKAACVARNARLPTEAEWEKAARGGCEFGSDPLRCDDGDARLYPWGSQAPTCDFANHSMVGPRGPQRCGDGPGPVDGTPRGAGPYGHLNLAGNVWEYVADSYHPSVYRSGRPENPAGPKDGRYRSLRGGAWDTFSTNMRVSNRFNDHLKGSTIGFRCVSSGAVPVIEDVALVQWSKVSVKVRQKSGSPLRGRWLVVTAFDAQDINPQSGLPEPGRSPVSEVGIVPNGQPELDVEIEIPDGSHVRFSAALDMGTPEGPQPAASSGGIGWAPKNHTVNGAGSTGITLELAPLPAHPRTPRP